MKDKEIKRLIKIQNLKQIFLGVLVSAGIVLISNSFTDLINLSSNGGWSGVYWLIIFSLITLFVHSSIIRYEKKEMSYGFFAGVIGTIIIKLILIAQ